MSTTRLDWKSQVRATLCRLYRASGLLTCHEALARYAGQRFMAILVFHRVADLPHEDFALTVPTARFRLICQMLARRFRVVPLGEIFRILRAGEGMPPRTVAITFDDCYHDNLAAARVLAEHGLPATFFVPTAYVGTDHVFDWDRDLPRMPNLSWDDVREMARLGFEIGSHTATHPNLGEVDAERAWEELTASRDVLQAEVGRPVRWFAHPFGFQNHLRPEYIPLISQAGYEGAVSAHGGFVRPGIDDRILPREPVPPFRSLEHLEVFLSGSLHWLYALKRTRPPENYSQARPAAESPDDSPGPRSAIGLP